MTCSACIERFAQGLQRIAAVIPVGSQAHVKSLIDFLPYKLFNKPVIGCALTFPLVEVHDRAPCEGNANEGVTRSKYDGLIGVWIQSVVRIDIRNKSVAHLECVCATRVGENESHSKPILALSTAARHASASCVAQCHYKLADQERCGHGGYARVPASLSADCATRKP